MAERLPLLPAQASSQNSHSAQRCEHILLLQQTTNKPGPRT